MAEIGPLNPIPTLVGGGPTETEKAYGIISRAMGKGGTARSDDGIDGLWRRSRAKGLAAATSAYRRAIYNAFAHLATDCLPSYERALGLTAAPGATEAQRRDAVWAAWITRATAVVPRMIERLQKIDSRFEGITVPHDYQTTTIHGRAFGPHQDGLEGPTFGGIGYSVAPNYSTDFVQRVKFDVGYGGALLPSDARKLERAKDQLRSLLPSWVTFSIVTSTGFYCNLSGLNLAGVNP